MALELHLIWATFRGPFIQIIVRGPCTLTASAWICGNPGAMQPMWNGSPYEMLLFFFFEKVVSSINVSNVIASFKNVLKIK